MSAAPLSDPSRADTPFPSVVSDSQNALTPPPLEHTYRAFAPSVLAYFRSHRMDNAEDLVGDVFVDVAQGLSKFSGDSDALRRWVFTIARRRRVDEVRRQVVRRLVVVRDPPERPSPDDPGAMDRDLVEALRALTTTQREVVILRFAIDLSIEDVARVLRRSPGAVKALQVRALNQLSSRLDPVIN